jgi:hypothetical protein
MPCLEAIADDEQLLWYFGLHALRLDTRSWERLGDNRGAARALLSPMLDGETSSTTKFLSSTSLESDMD